MQSLVIEPKIISIVTTNKCTAACKNCCFSCNSKNDFKSNTLLEDIRLKKYQKLFNKKIIITNGVWIPFTKSSEKEINQQTKNKILCSGKCESLFNTISINANHKMFACCGLTSNFTQQDEDSLYLETNTSFDLGEVAIPITMNFSKEQRDYIVFLQKLSTDIIENPIVAKEFAKNPELFLQRYGYNEPIDLDEGMMKMVMALGDEDINRAVKANDVKLFYNLCKEKNLLNARPKFNIEEYSNFLKTKMAENGFQFSEDELDAIWPVWAIGLVVVIYYGAAAVVGIGAGAYIYVYQVTEFWGTVQKRNADLLLEDNPTMNIWVLKGTEKDTYFAVNKFLENQIDDFINILKETNSTFFENNKEEDIRNFLTINMYK